MSRALHFHHRERLKKTRASHVVFSSRKSNGDGGMNEKELNALAARRVNTPTPCSCFMCGNPRKHFKQPTQAEKKAKQLHKENLMDI